MLCYCKSWAVFARPNANQSWGCFQGRCNPTTSISLVNEHSQERVQPLCAFHLADFALLLPLSPCSTTLTAIAARARSGHRQHININMSHACETCDREFGSWVAARQHMDALDHWDDEDEFECDKCDRTFTTQAGCNQHMTALGHWYTDICDTCERRFVNKQAAEQHMDALDHRASPYCSSCDRYFERLSDLYQHMNSPIHLRADPIHKAPAPPVRAVSISRPVPVSTPTPPAVFFDLSLPPANPQGTPQLVSASNTVPARPVVVAPPVAPAPAVISAQTTTDILSNTQLTKPCTTCIPFKAFIDKDASSIISHYQSISCMRSHQAFSFEELRLADYRAGCRPTNNGGEAFLSAIYRDQSTQTDILCAPTSSVYLSVTPSRATTSKLSANSTENETLESSTTTIGHAQEDRVALTADEIAGFHVLHEARCEARKLLIDDDNKPGWIKHGTGLIRILQCKTTAALHILMLAEKSGKIGMNFHVPLDETLHTVRNTRIVQLGIPDKEDEVDSHFCIFEDEPKAKQFLEALLEAVAKAQDSVIKESAFSLSEIKSQQTEPVVRPRVLSCPFCHIGFNAAWEVCEHLETSSCPQRPDLNCSNIHRHQRQQDLDGTMVLQTSNLKIRTDLYCCPNKAGGCKAKFMSSFSELIAHLESENCGFTKREELWKDISECGDLWEGIGGG